VQILSSNTVASIGAPSKIVEFDNHVPLLTAFNELVKANVLSAPVRLSETKEYVGFLDIRDLVSFVVFIYNEHRFSEETRLKDVVHSAADLKKNE